MCVKCDNGPSCWEAGVKGRVLGVEGRGNCPTHSQHHPWCLSTGTEEVVALQTWSLTAWPYVVEDRTAALFLPRVLSHELG